jgi:hypothetical protein
MVKNTHSTRAFVAFLVTWSFVVLTVTGVVLYVVPQGRVANWTFWSLAGLDKDGWADVHLLFGAVFIVAGALHLYFNWKPFTGYLAQRVRGHLALKRELATSLVAILLLTLGAVFAVPPVSWLFDLNDAAKSVWSRAPGHEPPYPRAEATPLPVLANRLHLDLDAVRTALRGAGVQADDPAASLETLARAQGTTPAGLFAVFPKPRQADAQTAPRPADPVEIEARLTGTGVGGKTLAQLAEANGLDPDGARERLAAAGIAARLDETLKAIAERYGTRPVEIAKALLVAGYRPEKSG